ncbi:MAG: sigma 54-interacting transcriptional regulator [Alphaproteobacteria bacterium]|nr:sigma 54-interacting transcriptional regulator [Alphaproteobacteria bacterium]MCB9694336.1 sigma 54-interacting transcriptional regulator [Alphaproteobacteria bacterium]
MADILIVDDQDRYLELCRAAIPEHRYRGPARDLAQARRELEAARGRIDLVLLDVHFDIPVEALLGVPEGATPRQIEQARRRQGLLILAELRKSWPDLPVIVMTSRDELALESEVAGDEDFTYFLDDDYVDARALQGQIQSLVASRGREPSTGPVYWGDSLGMRKLEARLDILARGRLPVVLLGPMGTGKSLLARHFVHARSGRPGKFVSVDLSTVPADLMAAHLFGSVKGAYTGSIADRTGAFEAAHQGTLFLDEVGNLSMAAQKMLLAVLQEGTVSRVGDLRERPVDVKLVVATNEDLRARVREGSFRSDLYMRLNPAAAVELPSLVERGLDYAKLLDFCLRDAFARPYLKGLVAEYREAAGLPPGRVRFVLGESAPKAEPGVLVILFPERAVRLLRRHSWPGNLREFAMTAENAVLFALAEMTTAATGDRSDVVTVRPKLVRDLLVANLPAGEEAPRTDGDVVIHLEAQDTLNKVSVECERQYFTALYLRAQGDFGVMAERLLGDTQHARKVQLRFNQLGLKVRELRERLP